MRPRRRRARAGEGERVAIRRRPRHRLDADDAAGAATILDDDGLPKLALQRLRQQASGEVDTATGREWDDHADGPRRIGLRPGWKRKGCRDDSSAPDLLPHGFLHRCPMEASTASAAAKPAGVTKPLAAPAQAMGNAGDHQGLDGPMQFNHGPAWLSRVLCRTLSTQGGGAS
jgi:hypothetical protein